MKTLTICISVMITFLIVYILPSPRPFLVEMFGENNPWAIVFIVLIGALLILLFNFVIDLSTILYSKFRKQNRN